MVRTSNKNEKNNATIDCTQIESAKLGGGNKVREWDTNLCRDGALYKFTSTLFYYRLQENWLSLRRSLDEIWLCVSHECVSSVTVPVRS